MDDLNNLKNCSKCHSTKETKEFYTRNASGALMAHCKACHNEWTIRWHKENKELHAEQMRNRKKQLKLEAMAHYGKVCACCFEAHEEFLELDHINNNGAEHRREVGKWRVGANMLRLLKKLGWPEGFQFLCSNCNIAKFRHGRCPHETERSKVVN
jgi:hypothetical protein